MFHFLVVILLTACMPVVVSETGIPPITTPAEETAKALLNATAQPSPSMTAASNNILELTNPTPTILVTSSIATPTPPLSACMKAGGRIEVMEFTTVLLPDPLVYRIYLPPCYGEESRQSYPVLYLIHGQTYSDTQWDRLGVPEIADQLIASSEVAPFIVVMPRDRIWKEPTEDNFGLAVEQSLIPWVDEHYRTIANRAHRAIGGLSRGGAWAIHLGLSHPELFSAIGVHSGFVFHTDLQPLYLWLYHLPVGMAPRIYIDVATDDRPEITDSATFLEELLTRYEVPHEWHMFVGEHEEAYWQEHVEDYLRWYTRDWNE